MKNTSTPYLAVLLWLLFLVGSVDSSAQHTQRTAPAGMVIKGYWEYLPPGYATGNNFPCIIFLHGSGERGVGTPGDLNKILGNGPPKHIKNGHNMCFTVNGKTECFVVLSPQTGKWSWKADVMPFVKWAIQNYKVDPDRIFCTGLSMGGEGTWFSACFTDNEPNVWAALGVMCGRASRTDGGNVEKKKISVWAFHGDADTSIGINAGLNPILGMRTQGGNPIWTVYPGVGHGGCWDRGYRTDHTYHNPNLYEWFLSVKRNNPGPRPPVVSAGTDITITLPTSSTTLTGTASDPDGTIASTQWSFVNGPVTITPATPAALSTAISGLTTAGTYTFALKATDNSGMSTSDQVVVTVKPEPPKFPPVANAGPDKTVAFPGTTVQLTGSGTDSDGTIKPNPNGYKWTQTGGPVTAVASSTTSPTVNYTGLTEPGSYTFTLTVTDNDNLTGSDQVVVTVLPEPTNAAPVANAGADQQITLPGTTTVNLLGTGTDDGTIASYAWDIEPGAPGSVTFSSQTTAATTISGLTTAGVYVFTLTVTDDKGLKDTDQVIVTVLPPPPNNPPTANAGTDITITLPVNQVTLNGLGTDSDGTVASYLWEITTDPVPADPPTIGSASTATTNVTNLNEGNYVFTLTVTDDDGAKKADQVIVKVLPLPPNDAPVANAGPDVNVTLPLTTATLVGSGTDSDGTIASYAWKKISGTGTTIASPTSATTQINGLTTVGTYTYELTVTDDKGVKGSDQVTVTVFPVANIPPTANAGTDFSITLPAANASLNGSGTDTDGTINGYLWEVVNGPAPINFSNAATAAPTVSPLEPGIYIFSLTVTDDDGAKGTDQVQLTVLPEPPNQPPVADAGTDVTLTLPDDQTTLTGSGTDADGSVVSYHWNLLAGPAGITLGDVDAQSLTVDVNGTAGTYSFELIISDDDGATATDEVKIFVNAQNVAPIVSAGPDKVVQKPASSTQLNGSSSDTDGTIVFREWALVSAPAGLVTVPTISSPGANVTNVTNFTLPGTYVYTLTVRDNDDVSSSDQVSVQVLPEPPNTPPVANAGPDLEITLPTNSVTINGSGTDPDPGGSITAYQWSQLAGNPGTVTATPPSMNQATITFSNFTIAGTYIFRLTVTDNKGAKGQKDVKVKVNPQPANIPPVANAGSDMPITLPVNSATLNGTGSDVDGSITKYEWTVINEPAGNGGAATFTPSSSTTTGTTNVSGLNTEGVYVFRLTVTDDDDVTSFDEVKITVNPIPANLPPIANGGGNKILTVPASTTTLSGSGTDTDGTIVKYTWTQRSSSNGDDAAMTGDNTATLNLSSLEEGIYLFRLEVTDNQGSTGFDEVNVRVQPVPANQPPTANGGGNKIITQPSTTVTFNGSATDPDGTIATYKWTQITISGAAIVGPDDTPSVNIAGLDNLETYIFRLTVTDNQGAQGFDEVNVRVNPEPPNLPPNASAGADLEITLPTSSVELNASGSTDSDGSITTFAWTAEPGSPTIPTIASTDRPTVTGLQEGIYTFKVTVTDDDGESADDYVLVTVNPEPANIPPTVNAGDDQIISSTTASLTGVASDADGSITTYKWTRQSGPAGESIVPDDAANATVSNLAEGTYVFDLTVTDNDGDTNSDQVTITVNTNQPPVAFAGGTINVVSPPNSSVTLAGAGSDADGIVVKFTWSKVSGADPGNVEETAVPGELLLEGLDIGQYVYELTVEDDKGATDTDRVTIEVTAAPTNQLPVAIAGADATIVLPDNSITLDGLASNDPDTDGFITAFSWEQLSGPEASISDPTFAELQIADLTEGTYVFALTVTDNEGATDTDEVTVNVVLEEVSTTIPKVFTPNGDAIGETWNWPAELRSQYEGCELTIYSRFGKKVFEMVSYDNSWNGTSSSGVKLEDEAYYYVIKCSDGQQTTGGVRIVR